MTQTEKRLPRGRIALAVGADRLVAVRLRGLLRGPEPSAVAERPLPPREGADWPGLAEAVAEAAAELGVSGGSAVVALLRPLGQAKVIGLPPVGGDELQALLRRSARRYFFGLDGPVVVDALRIPGPRRDMLAPTLAVAAEGAVVEAVIAAAEGAGFRVGAVVTAPVAAADAVRARVPGAARGRVAVAVCAEEALELLFLDRGVPRMVQPVAAPPGAEPVSRLASAAVEAVRTAEEEGFPAGRVMVVGGGERGDRLADLLAGSEDAPPVERPAELREVDGHTLCALGAAHAGARTPRLLPDASRAALARRVRRRAAALLGAAAAVLLLAAGVHYWGITRELRVVKARRAVLAPAVQEAMQARAAVEGVRVRLRALSELEETAPRWTPRFAVLAQALPDSAYLHTLTADSAGLRLGGLARSASAVVPALAASPGFGRVALSSPLRWESGDDGERFDVAAALEEPLASPPDRERAP